jgi:hypothetical protein
MKGGFEADIYRAVMMAIITIGPRSSMSLEEIRSSLASLIESPSDLPAKHEVTRVLNVLDELAKSTSQTDPVLEYDEEEDRLYILDPFFGFAARWIGGYVK